MIETVSEFLGRRSRELAERVGVLQGELNALSAELAVVERCLKAVDEPVAFEDPLERQIREHYAEYEKPKPAPKTTSAPNKRGYSSLILKRLPEWMKQYPAGLTVKEVAGKCKVSAGAIEAAFVDLRDSGRVVVYRDCDEELRVAPLGFIPDPPQPVISWVGSIRLGDAARTPATGSLC